jgi:hypothetical protein
MNYKEEPMDLEKELKHELLYRAAFPDDSDMADAAIVTERGSMVVATLGQRNGLAIAMLPIHGYSVTHLASGRNIGGNWASVDAALQLFAAIADLSDWTVLDPLAHQSPDTKAAVRDAIDEVARQYRPPAPVVPMLLRPQPNGTVRLITRPRRQLRRRA